MFGTVSAFLLLIPVSQGQLLPPDEGKMLPNDSISTLLLCCCCYFVAFIVVKFRFK